MNRLIREYRILHVLHTDNRQGFVLSKHAMQGVDSMRLKLLYELREQGAISTGPQDLQSVSNASTPWMDEVDEIWAIAMPSIFGLAGFNPLTVYYVYRRGRLRFAVLEVHNTFNERHMYICNVENASKAEENRRGYDYCWTFPRSFHVIILKGSLPI